MSAIDRLVQIMARLRDPQGGCPWDVEQDFASIAPYTLEEAYEVDHAIRRGDMKGLLDELGDLLLQVVFHARMAEEAGHFRFDDVVAAICDKLVRRHPHVFGEAEIRTAEEQTRSAQIDRPLDFGAVTDHAEFFGEVDLCTTPGFVAYDDNQCQLLRQAEPNLGDQFLATVLWLFLAGTLTPPTMSHRCTARTDDTSRSAARQSRASMPIASD